MSLATDVAPIFAKVCAMPGGCHSPSVLGSASAAYSYLVNVKTGECTSDVRMRVVPGDPSHSYLIDKLTNHAICYGDPMPKATPWVPLPSADLQKIYDWVCDGAKND